MTINKGLLCASFSGVNSKLAEKESVCLDSALVTCREQ